MRISVLGDGSWGTALALLLHDNGHQVTLWSAFSEQAREIREFRENRQFLPGVRVPSSLNVSDDLRQAFSEEGAEMAVLATPVQYLGAVLERLKGLGAAGGNMPVLVNVAKGIETQSCLRPSQLIRQALGDVEVCTLSGPSHAEEVVRKMPAAVVSAASDELIAKRVQDIFINEYFRVYTSVDIVGVELGGALKNVYAIAAGVGDGLGLGDNSKAALVTRAIAEMMRLGRSLGGVAETFSGLSGIGDLLVTCSSLHSRNRRFGEWIGQGLSLAEATEKMGNSVAEGVKTAVGVRWLAAEAGIEVPIVEETYQVLYEGKEPARAVRELMTREPGKE